MSANIIQFPTRTAAPAPVTAASEARIPEGYARIDCLDTVLLPYGIAAQVMELIGKHEYGSPLAS